jgi:FkbM family methyltransferase
VGDANVRLMPSSLLSIAPQRGARRRARRFYRRFVRPGDLCFDVGANMGERTDVFLALGARVVAVEPQTGCIDALQRRFGSRTELVGAALGARPGEAELLITGYHTLSSLSQEWIEAVTASGRFDEFTWDDRVVVPVTTLEELIGRFGAPRFCKIDVEGYELEVLRGLARPIPAISFEFAAERSAPVLSGVNHLADLGMTRFNFSDRESFAFALDDWVSADEICAFLGSIRADSDAFGEVYGVEAGR